MSHLQETSQQRGDRLLAEHQASRDAQPGHFIIVEGEPSRWDRFKRAARPWVEGFDHPLMDAIGIAFILFFTVLLSVFAAMCWADHSAPPASGAFSANMEATSRPAADSPLGGGAPEGAR